MKDSGIEWLGEIPAHWALQPLKYISPEITVGIVVTPARFYEDTGVPALRSLNIKNGTINGLNLVFLSEEANELHSKSKIYDGDLVAVRTGQPGSTAVVTPEFDGTNCIDLIIVRKSERAETNFMFLFLNSDAARVQYAIGAEGAIQQHFNVETAQNLLVCAAGKD